VELVKAGRDEAVTGGLPVARLLLPRPCFSTAGTTGTTGTAMRVAVVSAISKSSRHPGHLKGAFPEKFKDCQRFNFLDLFLEKKKKEKKKKRKGKKRKEIIRGAIHWSRQSRQAECRQGRVFAGSRKDS